MPSTINGRDVGGRGTGEIEALSRPALAMAAFWIMERRRASAIAGAYYPYLVAPISAGIDFIRRERAERAGG
ncbi:MAG TPA: hypothetical protein VN892_01835 [Solirubrobacteraceae bacterium]|nr:hypothetical protein [Solirubrobacteraceae bacterium]